MKPKWSQSLPFSTPRAQTAFISVFQCILLRFPHPRTLDLIGRHSVFLGSRHPGPGRKNNTKSIPKWKQNWFQKCTETQKNDTKKGLQKMTQKNLKNHPKMDPKMRPRGAKRSPWASTWAPWGCQNGSRKGDWHHQGRQGSAKDPPRSARNPPRTLGDRCFMIFPLFHLFFEEKSINFTVFCAASHCFALHCNALH